MNVGVPPLGNISSFVLYSRKFSGPINEFANIISDLQSALAAAERVFRLIDEEPEPADDPEARAMDDVRGHVEAQALRFSYEPGREILHGVDFVAPPGKVVAIVGETGCGKTTLINLLMRFYDADSGRITLDEHPIRSLPRADLRRAYTMVLQDTWLFYGTIRENIAYGKPDATEEKIVAAAKAAMIHGYIESLPQGYSSKPSSTTRAAPGRRWCWCSTPIGSPAAPGRSTPRRGSTSCIPGRTRPRTCTSSGWWTRSGRTRPSGW